MAQQSTSSAQKSSAQKTSSEKTSGQKASPKSHPQKKKTTLEEFGDFISRGNVMDLAIGVIIGGAFTAVANSLVSKVIQPLISFLTGGNNTIPGLTIDLNGNLMDFGAFISSIINFLITAAAVFAIMKALNKFNDIKDLAAEKAGLAKKEQDAPRTCPYCKEKIAEDATRCPHCTAELEGYLNPAE